MLPDSHQNTNFLTFYLRHWSVYVGTTGILLLSSAPQVWVKVMSWSTPRSLPDLQFILSSHISISQPRELIWYLQITDSCVLFVHAVMLLPKAMHCMHINWFLWILQSAAFAITHPGNSKVTSDENISRKVSIVSGRSTTLNPERVFNCSYLAK
jgi:hypothetical protein